MVRLHGRLKQVATELHQPQPPVRINGLDLYHWIKLTFLQITLTR